MAKRVSPALIGAFVLGAIGLAVLAIVMLGSGRIFQRTQQYVLFFKGSVNGLSPGAPVKFRGVQIGTVKDIRLNLNIPEIAQVQEVPSEIEIPVIIEINQSLMAEKGVRNLDLADPAGIRAAVKNGLRGQLGMESFVTGLLYVDLDMEPGTPAEFVLPPNTGWVEIPTVPTQLEEAQAVATEVLEKLRKVDFDKFLAETNQMLDSIHSLITSPQLKSAVDNLSKASAELGQTAISVRQLANNLSNQSGPLSKSLRETSESANATLIQAQDALASVQSTFEPTSPLSYQLNQTLIQISDAARSMRELADYLQRNPSSLVRGKYFAQDSK